MRLPERVGDQRRIGIAVEVPEPFGSDLQAARRRFGDPLADLIPPHITLLGPTVVEPSHLEDVHLHLERVARSAAPFEVLLRSSGSFRPVSPVVFVQVAQGIAECESLERRIRSGVLAQELRFNYHPHVTVAHEVDDEALDRAFEDMSGYEARFDVPALSLFEHGDDNVWRPVRSFVLGGAPEPEAVPDLLEAHVQAATEG
ncbi:2'-5' RNA ligase family protein [Sanguibacter suaedae]|uniref:2'-5' RNA ligase family protein n=1 Tax=Sanguibacter suaedae TaxID=2795737 RepID=A0A934I6J7_9MICO|nr:2'-5' RNA ligase family protein [Sanguibacter suaedae]MBI9115171.1 2'-5' RNA ligase family protein [Sanguibacter suaedae]